MFFLAKKILFAIFGIIAGFAVAYILVFYVPNIGRKNIAEKPPPIPFLPRNKETVGFLPYWLLSNAKDDYSKYISTLNYFDLSIGPDGKIVKLTNPLETEPGWNALSSGKADKFLADAKNKGLKTSLTVFSGKKDTIANLMNNPIENADNLIGDIEPIMKQHSFSDLNLDVEYTSEASAEARENFTAFAKEIKKNLNDRNLGTLTIDVAPGVFASDNLIDPKSIVDIADQIIIMAYDFHFTGSYVTGPVAPIGGFNINAEYDIKTTVKAAKKIIPPDKLILGIPLYGYEWETIDNFPRAATIPDTSLVISSKKVEDLLSDCSNCKTFTDNDAQEPYIMFPDSQSSTVHQIFYPNKSSTEAKLNFAKTSNLAGIAVWALGYENNSVLNPLADYKNSLW